MSEGKILNKLQEEAQRAKVSEIPAKNIMNRTVVVIRQGTKIYSAVQTLATHHLSGAPVVDGAGKMVGVISEYDLLMQTATKDVLDQIEFTHDALMISPDMLMKDVIILFFKKRLRWAPVVGTDKHVQGVITRIDLLMKLLSKGK
jgi:CBS-domain-containing membrane protein